MLGSSHPFIQPSGLGQNISSVVHVLWNRNYSPDHGADVVRVYESRDKAESDRDLLAAHSTGVEWIIASISLTK